MVKVYRGELSAFDLAAIGATPGVRTAVTPFSTDGIGIKRYLGRSVIWKGKKVPGAAGMSEAEIAKALGVAGTTAEGVATGVKKIASASKEIRGVTGVALYVNPRKMKRGIIPKRAAMLAKRFNPEVEIIREAPKVSALIAPTPYPSVVVPIPV